MYVKLKMMMMMMSSTTKKLSKKLSSKINKNKKKATVTIAAAALKTNRTRLKSSTIHNNITTKWVNCLLLLLPTTSILIASLILVPTTHGLTSNINERGGRKLFGGYRITPKFCKASKTLPKSDPRSDGPTICMFNHECAQRDGQVVGACMDGFLFGACCQIHGEIDSNLLQQFQTSSSQSNLAAAYETYGQHASNEIKNNGVSSAASLQQSSSSSSSSLADVDTGASGGSSSYTGNADQTNNVVKDEYGSSDLVIGSNYYDTNGASDLDSESDQGELYASGSNGIYDDQQMPSLASSSNQEDNNNIKIPSVTSPIYNINKNDEIQYSQVIGYSTEAPLKLSATSYDSTYEDNASFVEATENINSVLSEAENQETNEVDQESSGLPSDVLAGINEDSEEFSQSGIAHGEAEAVLIEDDLQFSDGYGPIPAYLPAPPSLADKNVHQKPIFKPKPQTTSMPSKVTGSEDNYVLVQTISNDKYPSKKPAETITTNDMESIESIILMLNDTKTGPTYNIETATKVMTSPVTHRPTTVSTTTQVYHKYEEPVTVKPQTSTNYGPYTERQTQNPISSTSTFEYNRDETSPSYGMYKPSKKPIYSTSIANYHDKNERPIMSTDSAFYEQYGTKFNSSIPSHTASYSDKYGPNFASSNMQKPVSYGQYGQYYGSSSMQTQKPILSTNTINKFETYRPNYSSHSHTQPQSHRPTLVTSASFAETASAANNLNYVVTSRPINAEVSTNKLHVTSKRPQIISAQTGYYDGTPSSTYGQYSTYRPQVYSPSSSHYNLQKDPSLIVSSTDSNMIDSSTYRPTQVAYTKSTTTRPPLITRWPINDRPTPVSPVIQDNQIIISPSRRPPTLRPTLAPKLPSTSYLMGPTPPRPPSNIVFTSTTPRPSQNYQSSTSGNLYTTQFVTSSNYYSSSSKPVISQTYRPVLDTSYLGVMSTTQRPSPTVIITPKPTVNLITSSSWTQKPGLAKKPSTTTKIPGTSYIFSSVVTKRPTTTVMSPTQNIDPASFPVISNDFDDSGYFGITATDHPAYVHSTSEILDTRPPSRPSYSNYYGTTLNYDTFNVPTVSDTSESVDEETYTSPNDFVNFPPVRNPNLNLSATASAVTDEFDFSTPSFVEDDALKEKMHVLVNKIVESLQGNFEILADIIEERNTTIANFVASQLTTTLRPVTTRRTVGTSKRTQTRVPTRAPTKIVTRSPTKAPTVRVTTIKPSQARPGTKATKPAKSTKPTKATKRPTTTKKGTEKVSTKKPPTVTTKKPINFNRVTSSKPVGTRKPVTTTRRPVTTTRKSSQTKKPASVPTKKSQVKVTTIATKRPLSTRRTVKPTRRAPTTTTELTFGEEESTGDTTLAELETSSEENRQFQCGVRPHVKSGRIVGGKGATFGEWPWQVLVRESTWLGLFTKNKCGGVLISNKFVITAAHCQPGFLASLVTVFGEFDISGDLEAKRSVTKNVKRVIVHRQYDAATFENDLALLELESPIHYDTHIVPICMPPDEIDYTGRMATVTGWGRLKYGGGVPSVLQEVQVPVIENSVCQEMFNTGGHKKRILPSFLCAGYANGQKDSCEGDSGGPLVIQRDDGRWELVGTVSHGIKCAAPYLPGVYMRTSYYKPWIKSVTGIK